MTAGLVDLRSTAPWLGLVNAEWPVTPVRSVLRRSRKLVGSRSESYTLLSLTLHGVIPRDLSVMRGKFPASFDSYQVVEQGDLVFCLFDVDETPRTVGVSTADGMITGAYDVYRASDPLTRRMLAHLFLSLDDLKALKPLYRGLRKTVPRPAFEGMKICLPPAEQMAGVVRYLDHQELTIARVLRARSSVLARLNELRSSVIAQMVLGTDPTNSLVSEPALRVPATWEVVPFWSAASERSEKNRTDLELLSVYLDRGVIRHSESSGQVHKPSLDLSAYQRVAPGDLVLNNQQAWRGSVGVSPHEGIVSPAYLVYDIDERFDPEWANFLFRSPSMVSQFEVASRGVGSIQRQVHRPSLRTVRVPVPPISEQREIAARIVAATERIDRALSAMRNEVSLLTEYRTRLIADVVRGRLDVRAKASALPEIDAGELAEAQGAVDVVDDIGLEVMHAD